VLTLVNCTLPSQALSLDNGSTDGNKSLSGGETAGLVVRIIGIFLTALSVFKGWECWKSRRKVRDATDVDPLYLLME